ncbi:MAG: D-alanine--D-alanine ligase [Candidatus Methylomirabilis sp.]|nr:D-alanine--D-alanine ligase [Deltaproteobacteria bacterium]
MRPGILKKKKIGVLMGGTSEEREISLKTGSAVLGALLEKGYRAVAIDAGKDLPAKLRAGKIDVAFIALHGRHGEDGCVQGLLEVMGIPYTGSGVRASAMAMDKVVAKKVMESHGVSTPKSLVYSGKGAVTLRPPLVVKPACQGSAIGVSIVKGRSGLKKALELAESFRGGVLVEKYIEGRELTIGILDGTALPTIEIRPRKGGFYDYKAKYTKGMTDFLVPAPIAKAVDKRAAKEALAAYRALGCSGAARVDLMLGGNGTPYVLEVNTVPGMTELSLLPRAAEAAGMDYPALVEEILKGAGLDKY